MLSFRQKTNVFIIKFTENGERTENIVLKLRKVNKTIRIQTKQNKTRNKGENPTREVNEETTMTKVHKCQAKSQYVVCKTSASTSHVDRIKEEKTKIIQDKTTKTPIVVNTVNTKNTLDRTINSLRTSEASARAECVSRRRVGTIFRMFLRVRFQCCLARR